MPCGIWLMYQACQSSAIHPQGKWDMPLAIIGSMGGSSQQNVSPQCQIREILVYLWQLQIQEVMPCGIWLMYQACQSSAIHPQGKWDMPLAIIGSMGGSSQQNVSPQCQICEILAYLWLL